jgi:formylglycine-generating enzyme required for sulfatase activity
MKYAASNDGSGKAVSVKALPWVSINRDQAEVACQANGANYHLITNDEWMVIARNIEANAANWSGGAVGNGDLSRGNSNSSSMLSPGNDNQPHFGLTANLDWAHKRTHLLSNNEMIWDMAGNVWQWVAENLITRQHQWQEYNVDFPGNAIDWQRFAPFNTYNSRRNVGWIYMDDAGAAVRGGNWTRDTYAGVFAALLNFSSFYSTTSTGFRCVARLP